MANTKLVLSNSETSNSYTTSIQQQAPSITRKNNDAGSFSFIKQYIQNKGLQETAKHILLSSWQNSTRGRYASAYWKWGKFCISRNINSFQPAVEEILVFLTDLYEHGLGYSSICSAQSALNNIIISQSYPDISENPLIKRFVKGVFNIKPPTPRSAFTWDMKKVLNYMDQLAVTKEKNAMLLLC